MLCYLLIEGPCIVLWILLYCEDTISWAKPSRWSHAMWNLFHMLWNMHQLITLNVWLTTAQSCDQPCNCMPQLPLSWWHLRRPRGWGGTLCTMEHYPLKETWFIEQVPWVHNVSYIIIIYHTKSQSFSRRIAGGKTNRRRGEDI